MLSENDVSDLLLQVRKYLCDEGDPERSRRVARLVEFLKPETQWRLTPVGREHRMPSLRRKLVGHVGVDAGMVMVADPCYVVGEDAQPELKGPWDDFLNRHSLLEDSAPAKQIGQHSAVVVSNFGGDGCYPVFIEFGRSGEVARLVVEFDAMAEDSEDVEEEEDD